MAHFIRRQLRIAAGLVAAIVLGCGLLTLSGVTGVRFATAIIATAAADPPESLADRLKAVQSGAADKAPPKRPPLPQFKPVDADTSKMVIPIVKGLFEDAAYNDPAGDYEWFATIQDVTAEAVKYREESSRREFKKCQIVVDAADIANARSTRTWVCAADNEHYPGNTNGIFSTAVLNQLRNGQAVEFYLPQYPNAHVEESGAIFMRMMNGEKVHKSQLTYYAGLESRKFTLTRVSSTDVAVPVLVNGQPAKLPALRASCAEVDPETGKPFAAFEFYVLDQPSYPLLLVQDEIPTSLRVVQVIKITFPEDTAKSGAFKMPAAAPSKMEQELADKKPVQVYGIYFDFNSAEIRPESEPTLKEIAGIMQKNPDWKLSVSGHTDNIGGNKSNLALSERRSAAVKDALVSRYKIAPDRLLASGYGASAPIDTNDTFEGRARNRRVELRRE